MGLQRDDNDDPDKNTRTISMWSSVEQNGETMLSSEYPPGWGWLRMVLDFPHDAPDYLDYKTADFSEDGQLGSAIKQFNKEVSHLKSYQTSITLLTKNRFLKYGSFVARNSIAYGIYDLCWIDCESDSFITQMHDVDSSITQDKYKQWASLAAILRKACMRHIITFKKCSEYRIGSQFRYMQATPGQYESDEHMDSDQKSYQIPHTVANDYTDKNGAKRTYINYPLLLQALHANHNLYQSTALQLHKALTHVDVYETASHNNKMKFKLAWAAIDEEDDIPPNVKKLLNDAEKNMRAQFALETTCDFLTTCAMAMVEDQYHDYHHMYTQMQHQQWQEEQYQQQQQQQQEQNYERQQEEEEEQNSEQQEEVMNAPSELDEETQQETTDNYYYHEFLKQLSDIQDQIDDKQNGEFTYVRQYLKLAIDSIDGSIQDNKKHPMSESTRKKLMEILNSLREKLDTRDNGEHSTEPSEWYGEESEEP